jgi:hypothetical protein
MRLLDGVGDMTDADEDSHPLKLSLRVEDRSVADGVDKSD